MGLGSSGSRTSVSLWATVLSQRFDCCQRLSDNSVSMIWWCCFLWTWCVCGVCVPGSPAENSLSGSSMRTLSWQNVRSSSTCYRLLTVSASSTNKAWSIWTWNLKTSCVSTKPAHRSNSSTSDSPADLVTKDMSTLKMCVCVATCAWTSVCLTLVLDRELWNVESSLWNSRVCGSWSH